MKLYELSINEFLHRVDSNSPTPGGGSVSAMVIAQGISLIRMCAHLTISKKKFRELSEDVKLDYMSRITSLAEVKTAAMEMIDLDTLAFNKIMAAYKLPKATDQEKKIRSEEINKATIQATETPLKTAKLGLKALELAKPTFTYANKSTTSDFGVGVNLIMAGINGAILNVKTNMVAYYDEEVSLNYYKTANEIEAMAQEIADNLLDGVHIELNR